jgi:polyisoprenoid-binding protein YceI
MKNLLLIAGLALLVVSCKPKNAEQAAAGSAGVAATAEGANYSIAAEKSTFNWRGAKPGGEHTGTISFKSGSITSTGNVISAGSFVVDMNSIVCTDLTDADMNGKLVGHLKSEDFFHTAQFPEAVFEIVSVSEAAVPASESKIATSHNVTGNLTLRGTTKSITFPALIEVTGESITAKTNEFSIDRTQWSVNAMSKTVFAELKDRFVDDAINLKLDLVFVK